VQVFTTNDPRLGNKKAETYLLPGFIDAHCHILPSGLDLLKCNLRTCTSKDEVFEKVADAFRNHNKEGWFHATQYDQTKFEGAQHITRHDLDKISDSTPILLRHSNGHASVANSAALRAAGVTRETPDPEGGEFVRDAAGEPNGVLLEKAHQIVTSSAPAPTTEQMVEAILRAGESMSSFGITTATDMMTGRWNLAQELEAYRLASERGCKIRLRLYVQWADVLSSRAIDPALFEELQSAMDPTKCKVLGLKVFADGAIGSATAAIKSKFLTTGGQGQLIYPEEKLAEIIAKIDAAGYSCAVHTIGDYSTDLVMDAYEKTDDPKRHRIEHAMILSEAQIERMARLGSHLTVQPEFLMRFGHAYRVQLEPEIAANLKPVRSLLDAGIPLSLNSDRPIVPGNPWDGIAAAIQRPEGFNPAENISLEQAIGLYTHGGAQANFEPEFVGKLKAGFAADYQVYTEKPHPGATPSEVFMDGKIVQGTTD